MKKIVHMGYINGILLVAFGLISLMNPGILLVLLMIGFGIALILSGATQLALNMGPLSTTLGVGSIVAGVFACIAPILLGVAVWTTILLILGIERIIHIIMAISLGIKRKFSFPKVPFILDIALSALVAFLFIGNPEIIGVTILKIVAIIITIMGVLSLVGVYRTRKRLAKMPPEDVCGEYEEL